MHHSAMSGGGLVALAIVAFLFVVAVAFTILPDPCAAWKTFIQYLSPPTGLGLNPRLRLSDLGKWFISGIPLTRSWLPMPDEDSGLLMHTRHASPLIRMPSLSTPATLNRFERPRSVPASGNVSQAGLASNGSPHHVVTDSPASRPISRQVSRPPRSASAPSAVSPNMLFSLPQSCAQRANDVHDNNSSRRCRKPSSRQEPEMNTHWTDAVHGSKSNGVAGHTRAIQLDAATRSTTRIGSFVPPMQVPRRAATISVIEADGDMRRSRWLGAPISTPPRACTFPFDQDVVVLPPAGLQGSLLRH